MAFTFKDEFLLQWKDFSATIESSIIKQVKEDKFISIEKLNNIISIEKNKWLSPYQYQGIWLDKIKKIDSKTGDKFERLLKSISLQKVPSPPEKSIIPYLSIAAAAGIFSYFLAGYFKLAFWQVWGAAIIASIFAGGTLLEVQQNSNQKMQMNCRKLYMEQIGKYRDELVKLCEMVENK